MTLFKQIFGLALFVLVLNYFYPAQKKPDVVRERMIYDQSLSEVFDGEHSYINYKYGKFSSLEIYNDDKDSAILYLHGRGLSPNDYNLAHPIRTQFSGNFNTYNIQLPVLEKGSTYNDYVDILYDSDQRIISAIEYISSKNDRLVDKDLKEDNCRTYISKSLDLHGFSLDEANKKVESFLNDCFEKSVYKVLIVTGKGLHSQNDKDPYKSNKLGILKYSVPEFIKNNSELKKKIKDISDADIEDGGAGAFYVFLKKKL